MSLLDWQRDFAGRLLAGTDPGGRMGIYRRSVTGSLVAVVAEAFPATRHTLGEERFAALARDFVAAQPPAAAALWQYGDGFPDYLAGRMGQDDPPWAVDLAALEWATTRAAVAADAAPIDPAALTAIPVERMGDLRLVLHPAMAVVASPWPLILAWQAWRGEQPAPTLVAGEPGSAILAARIEGRMVHRPLDPVQGPLLTAWAEGAPLLRAAADAATIQAELAFLLRHGLLIGVDFGETGAGT